jgi:8-oxo-dGTP diphosphatase
VTVPPGPAPHVRVGVAVFVVRHGRILMGRRYGAHGADTWSLPGGHLEYGETPAATACREAYEETGLEIREPRLVAVTNDVFVADRRHYVTLWMLSDDVTGDPAVTEPDRYRDLDWYAFDQLPEPLFQPWRELLGTPAATEIAAVVRATA